MKNIFKIALGTVALTAATAMAAPQFPFPQNMASPNGYTVPFATTSMIQDHFKTWKQAWYQDKGSEAWILAPEGTSSTVSEAIAYGMLIMVYMSDAQNDYQAEFDKLYATWKNHGGNGGGMDWRIGSGGGTGSATDADVDAALALVMASKQWNKASYLDDAKKIISWMATNDFDANNSLKPGSQWNDAFNPSYATLGHFRLFEKVSNDAGWSTRRQKAAKDLQACQDASTGLVPDWCDWNSHKPTRTNASVAQDEAPGFFDDAARTPWRTAWAYYWYGDSDALSFNKKIANWMIPATKTASGINSGYYVNGEAETSVKRNFVSSTFSGGLGLAASSLTTTEAKNYMETVYKTLSSLTSCATANGCGEGTVKGEKYYPSTLNLLYLLIMTGNMPNFYDMTGFTKFVPDPSLMRSSDSGVDGVQQERGDTTVGISGFWNWGAYHDKLGIGTKMSPDSGASPLFLRDGAIYADAVMEIGPEPEWTQAKADVCKNTPANCELKYPSAGIAMSFLKDDTKGVDLSKLNIKSLRITYKSEGPIRVAILNEATVEAGAEPGAYLDEQSDYKPVTFDLTPCDYGFGPASKCASGAVLDILSWVNQQTAPMGSEILKSVKGLKFEVKDAKGGYGAISVKAVEFLDASGSVVEPSKITGIVVPDAPVVGPAGPTDPTNPDAIVAASAVSMAKVSVAGMNIMVDGAKAGSDIAVFNMQGKVVASTKAIFGSQTVTVPNKGVYMVRVGNKMNKVVIK